MNKSVISADAALERLMSGNREFLNAKTCGGNISPDIRRKTCIEGQHPYAVVITCSDSRVIPESIFNVGIGELFVIRVAGNVVAEFELGSIEYAVSHLGCPLVMVLGHDHCGAVGAALQGGGEGHIAAITDEIKRAVGEETDDLKACKLNVQNSVRKISDALPGVKTAGAVYHLEDGKVELI